MKLAISIIFLALLTGCASVQDDSTPVTTGSTDHRDIVYETVEQEALELHLQEQANKPESDANIETSSEF